MATIGDFMKPKDHSDVVDPQAIQPSPLLSVPATIPFEPAPTLSVPMAVQNGANPLPPAPSLPSSLPFEAAPPLSTPAVMPFEPAPVLSTPAVIPFEPAPILSQPAPVLDVSGSTPGPTKYSDSLDTSSSSTPGPAKFSDAASAPITLPPTLSDPADLKADDQKAGKALPGDDTCKAMVDDFPKHSDNVMAATEAQNKTPGYLEKELQGLAEDLKGMLKNQTINNQVVVTIPGIGGMAPIPLPLDLSISTHGDKMININADLHLRQAGVKIATTALTYGRSKAQAAINAGLSALTRRASPTVKTTPTSLLTNTGPNTAGTMGETFSPDPSNPGSMSGPGIISVPEFNVEPVDYETPYNADARSAAQSKQDEAADLLYKSIGDHNKYNDKSKASDYYPDDTVAQQTQQAVTKNPGALGHLTTRTADQDPSTENRYDSSATSLESAPKISDLLYLNNPASGTSDAKKTALSNLWTGPTQLTLKGAGAIPNQGLDLAEPMSDGLVQSFTNTPAGFRTSQNTEETRGYFAVRGTAGAGDAAYAFDTPSDDQAYVPLVFTDLRPLQGGKFRTVYFRPFIKSLSEDFAPQWNMANYFGRVDPVATYQNTNRTISLSFKIVSFSPEDLETIYQKLGWLTSMVYPEFESGATLRYFSGPVIKMRVGDVINALGADGNRGVPGVITSLNFNYDESPWELLEGRRVPKNIDVSLGFHALHEYAIGSIKGGSEKEGGLIFGGIDATTNGPGGAVNVKNGISRFRATFGKEYLNNPAVDANPKTGT